jgi:putative flippase GtrA
LTDLRSARALLGPGSGLTGQGFRYAVAGVFVAGVYLLTTTILAVVVGLPFQVALSIGFGSGLGIHFTVQRLFVWVHEEEFALPFFHQARRYLVLAGAQYAVTATTTSLLPRAVGLSAEIIYLITVTVLATANFLLFRNVVFHPKPADDGVSG